MLLKKITLASLLLVSCWSHAYEPGRYDDGARWAFITDEVSKNIAVIDTFKHSHVDTLQMQAIPTAMEVSDVQDMLLYIDGKNPVVYVYDLVEKKHWQMAVESVPISLTVAPDGARLAVGLANKLVMLEPLTGRYLETINQLAQPYSVNFDTGGYNLYITEQNSGRTLVWRVHDEATREIQLGSGGKVSEVTLSPDARLVMVGDLEKNRVTVWDLFMNQEFAQIPLQSKPWRPYVSSDSEHMILAAENGQGLVVNSWSGQTVKSVDFKDQTTEIRTGWLESIGVVATQTGLNVFNLTNSEPTKHFPLKSPLGDVVVVSDSKTLFATQANDSQLLVVDLRKETLLPQVNTGLQQPNLIAMGLTNTICH
ncbi:methylamine dehydrogenase [Vibrio ponticus]|uniref:Methylamine dehydrogenase n=1 Tax=Vibrio ponticus TaxID=265668 RepID=A0A3N3E690_9VIBR|nr:methylamine dehydrogenase [Vibrio ponticus]OLQ89075.1 methylamine dehydrogenase [Vibrio ponticus]ROV62194.1 WD40 repeat domain-containing protein [Vibrio ponticus]